jgi:hypothetical protein
MVTPTPFPTAVGTAAITIPAGIASKMAQDSVQAWNMFGSIGTAIQVALILIIVFGGLTIIVKGLKDL